MAVSFLLCAAVVLLRTSTINGDFIPVYGFNGASSTVATGRSLHYTVHLDKCQLVNSPDPEPELAETFGGRVTAWRTFNDRDISDIPFVLINDQKMIHNDTGRLAQLSRQMKIWSNNTVDISTIVYTPDFGVVTLVYTHTCNMSSADTPGHIDLQASSNVPTTITSFQGIIDALENGEYFSFTVMSFLCAGGKEHTFSNFGGRVSNYELKTDGQAVKMITSNVQQTVHFDAMSSSHVVDVINVNFHDNRTVEVIDTRARLPSFETNHDHVSYCFLETGAPGGTVTVFV